MDLNEPVEIAPGVIKRLGDCTPDDLRAAQELLEVRGIRHRAAADRLTAGQARLCDWQGPDGRYCENEAEWIQAEGRRADDGVPRSFCDEHLPPGVVD